MPVNSETVGAKLAASRTPLRSEFSSVDNQDAGMWMVVCQPRFFGIIPNGAASKHGVLENGETQ